MRMSPSCREHTHTHMHTREHTCTWAYTQAHMCAQSHLCPNRCAFTDAHSHSPRTHTHPCAHTVSALVPLTQSHVTHSPRLHLTGEAPLAWLPLFMGTTWANARFQRAVNGPATRPPGASPAPPLSVRAAAVLQSPPQLCLEPAGCPRTLHDMTRPDRRKEQAPRSHKMQEKVPSWTLADQTAACQVTSHIPPGVQPAPA